MARKSVSRALAQPAPSGVEVSDPRLAQLLSYWETARGNRLLPSRTDIDPVALKFLLGHILLLEVGMAPLHFRIRLQGSEMPWIGCDLTGKSLEAIPSRELYALAFGSLAATVEARAPLHKIGEETIADIRRRFEALLLPLGNDGATVNMVLAAVLCRDDRAKR
jgi:hypothetical protein